MRKKSVLYTGSFRYPDKDAAAFRVRSIISLLKEQRLNVDVAGWESGDSYEHEGIKCYPQNELDKNHKNLLRRLLSFVFKGFRTFLWIKKNSIHDVYILYNPPFIFSIAMILWAKMKGKVLILDSTEWYESSHLPGGRFGIVSIENWFRMRASYILFNNIICISSYLHKYYSNDGRKNVICIPPLAPDKYIYKDVERNEKNDSVVFFYAGQPGKKDSLVEFISKFPELEVKLQKKIEIIIAGPSEAEVKNIFSNADLSYEKYKLYINLVGKLERSQIFDYYFNVDFSVIFRENKRYAYAGFPTKGMESLICGCPIVLNSVGDISCIASKIEAAVIVDDVEEFDCQIFNSKFNRTEISKSALKYFHPSNFASDFLKFSNGALNVLYRD